MSVASKIYIMRSTKALNNLVNEHPDATFYHTPLWSQVLEEAGLGKVYYLVIDNNFGHPLFLHHFVKEEEIKALIIGLRKFALINKILTSYINLPEFIVQRISSKYIHILIPQYIIPILRIESNNIEQTWKRLKKKRRNNIRKAIKLGVKVKEVKTFNDVKEYYKMYLRLCLRKHIKPWPITLFGKIYSKLNNKYRLWLLAIHKGRPIAGLIAFKFKGIVHIFNNVSYEEYWWLRPNDLLYWHAVEHAHINSFKVIDFGKYIEINNPINPNDKLKYHLKSYIFASFRSALVDMDIFEIPTVEERKPGLLWEMRHLKIKGESSGGNLLFKGADHRIVCWAMAFFLIDEKFNITGRRKKVDEHILEYISNFREHYKRLRMGDSSRDVDFKEDIDQVSEKIRNAIRKKGINYEPYTYPEDMNVKLPKRKKRRYPRIFKKFKIIKRDFFDE